MTIALQKHTIAAGATNASVTTTAVDTTVNSTNLIVLLLSHYTGAGTISISDSAGGNTWVPLTEQASGPGATANKIWYCLNPTNVSSSHTFTAAASSLYGTLAVMTFSGVASYDQQSGNTVTTGATTINCLPSGNLTPSANNALVVYSCSINAAPTVTCSPTSVLDSQGSIGGQAEGEWTSYQIQTTATGINPTFSFGSTQNAAAVIASFLETTGGGVTTISGSPGTYTYSGTTSTTNQLINQVAGAWSWAGSTSTLSQVINQSVGNYSYAGTTATLSQLIKQVVGSYTWSGTTSGIAGPLTTINASVGAWSWSGTTSTPLYCTNHTSIPGNAIPGCSWPGMGVGTQYINQSTGQYSWLGTTANIFTLLQASVGAYTWSGTTSSLSQLVNQSPGTYSWSGTTSSVFAALTINSSPGEYTWQGTTSSLVQSIVISSSTGTYTWKGQTSSIVVPTVLTPNTRYIVKASVRNYTFTAPYRSYIVKAPTRNYTVAL